MSILRICVEPRIVVSLGLIRFAPAGREDRLHETQSTLAEAAILWKARSLPRVTNLLGVYRQANSPPALSLSPCDMSLLEFLRRRSALTESLSRQLSGQLCCGLAGLHASGILHGDLKPGNVLLVFDSSLRLRICDFGSSWNLPPPGKFSTRLLDKGSLQRLSWPLPCMRGTLSYLAPEAFSDRFGCPADVWSAGLIMYEFAAGAPASSGTNMEDVLKDYSRILETVEPTIATEEGSPVAPPKLSSLHVGRGDVQARSRMLVDIVVCLWGEGGGCESVCTRHHE